MLANWNRFKAQWIIFFSWSQNSSSQLQQIDYVAAFGQFLLRHALCVSSYESRYPVLIPISRLAWG